MLLKSLASLTTGYTSYLGKTYTFSTVLILVEVKSDATDIPVSNYQYSLADNLFYKEQI
jgi:hypothetical protein